MGTETLLEEVVSDDDDDTSAEDELATRLDAVEEPAADEPDTADDATEDAELDGADDVAVDVPETTLLVADDANEVDEPGASDVDEPVVDVADAPELGARELEPGTMLEDCPPEVPETPEDAWDTDVPDAAEDDAPPLEELSVDDARLVLLLEPTAPLLLPSATVDVKRQKPPSQT